MIASTKFKWYVMIYNNTNREKTVISIESKTGTNATKEIQLCIFSLKSNLTTASSLVRLISTYFDPFYNNGCWQD